MNIKLALFFAIVLHIIFLLTISSFIKPKASTLIIPAHVISQSMIVSEPNLGTQKTNQQASTYSQSQAFAEGHRVRAIHSIAQQAASNKSNPYPIDQLALLLHNAIQAGLIYPTSAKLQQQQGVVEVKFLLQPSGVITDSSVVKTSGYAVLDAAALQTLQKISPLSAVKPFLTSSQTFIIAVKFYLLS